MLIQLFAADNADTSAQTRPTDLLEFGNWNSGDDGKKITDASYRDTASWYHVVIIWDSGNGTPADRMQMWVNGVRITDFGTDTDPDLNQDTNFNKASPQCTMHLGAHFGRDTTGRWNGYMAEVAYVDGTVYTASDFGEFNEESPTIWQPKDFAGDITWGNNGLYLDFKDSANLGADVSGNGNDLTESGFTAADQATDSPTNNFCTMNPLDNYYAQATFTEGNCELQTHAGYYTINTATMGMTAGKWYWECKLVADSGSGAEFQHGITDIVSNATDRQLGVTAYSYAYKTENGDKKNNNVETSYGDTAAVGDIVSVALDLDNLKIYFAKNGTWQDSGDPTSGASGTGAAFTVTAPALTTGGQYLPANGDGSASSQFTYGFNFGGCSAFDVASANQDGNGYGNFEYAVPSGYLALCTKNLGSDGG